MLGRGLAGLAFSSGLNKKTMVAVVGSGQAGDKSLFCCCLDLI